MAMMTMRIDRLQEGLSSRVCIADHSLTYHTVCFKGFVPCRCRRDRSIGSWDKPGIRVSFY